MAGIIYDLIDTLEEQHECYEGMLVLASMKENALISNDLENLVEIVEREEEFIARNNKLDKLRQGMMSDICILLGLDRNTTTLKIIADSINNNLDIKEQLNKLRVDILEVVDKISKQNSLNTTLINHSLEFTEFTINAIQGIRTGIQEVTYENPIRRYEQTTKSIFDTRG